MIHKSCMKGAASLYISTSYMQHTINLLYKRMAEQTYLYVEDLGFSLWDLQIKRETSLILELLSEICDLDRHNKLLTQGPHSPQIPKVTVSH